MPRACASAGRPVSRPLRRRDSAGRFVEVCVTLLPVAGDCGLNLVVRKPRCDSCGLFAMRARRGTRRGGATDIGVGLAAIHAANIDPEAPSVAGELDRLGFLEGLCELFCVLHSASDDGALQTFVLLDPEVGQSDFAPIDVQRKDAWEPCAHRLLRRPRWRRATRRFLAESHKQWRRVVASLRRRSGRT